MKNLYLGYETARWYWEHAVNGAQTLREKSRRSGLANCATTPKEVREVVRGTLFEGVPLHVITNVQPSRRGEDVFFHVHKGDFPKESFVRLSAHIFMATPQLSFVQMARDASFGAAFMFGSALCGGYALDESEESGRVDRSKLVAAHQLQQFTQTHSSLSGVVNARKVARYLIDDSASPRETAALGTLALPLRYGGKALRGAVMNYRIDVPSRYAWPGKRNYFVADLCWPDAKVVVEYDSDVAHAHKFGIYRDSEKRNTLIDMGYTPICLTSMQLDSPSDLTLAAETIRRALGRRRQPLPPNYDERVAQLRKDLGLPWFEGQKSYC